MERERCEGDKVSEGEREEGWKEGEEGREERDKGEGRQDKKGNEGGRQRKERGDGSGMDETRRWRSAFREWNL